VTPSAPTSPTAAKPDESSGEVNGAANGASSPTTTTSPTGANGTAVGAGDEKKTKAEEAVAGAGEEKEPLSEKAKGKLPITASLAEKPKFQPTMEWFNYWKSHLRLSVLITLVDALGPPIEALCIEKGVNDDKKVIEYLQSGTLVGLLPIPHPLFTRRFTYTEAVRIWFMSYMWGCIFMKSANPVGGAEMAKLCPSIWTGTKVQLFNVKITI
ncbi:cell wall biogenesis protein, partial [Blyttiomyces sp. JEL0837]